MYLIFSLAFNALHLSLSTVLSLSHSFSCGSYKLFHKRYNLLKPEQPNPAWSSTARPDSDPEKSRPANASSARSPTRLTKTLAPLPQTPPSSSTKTTCSGPETFPNRTTTNNNKTKTNTTQPLLPPPLPPPPPATSTTSKRVSLSQTTVSASSRRFPRTKRLHRRSEMSRTFTRRPPPRPRPRPPPPPRA